MPRCPHCNGKKVHPLKRQVVTVHGKRAEIAVITCPSIVRIGKQAARLLSPLS